MFIADLHIHSHYSRATSRDLTPELLDWWARRKGIQVVGTGDFTHPGWRQELAEKLIPAEEGLYRLREDCRRLDGLPAGGEIPVRFMITGEISSIYKWDGRVRKVHSLILLPGLEEAEALALRLEQVGNLHSDGRPILGLDARDLLEITLDVCPRAVFIPAHIWTPHFSLFGANSGFDRIEDCFRDLTPHIHALETGLSSDPPMNWRLSALDKYTLVSHSDAHSPAKLGREADLFTCEMTYPAIKQALENKGAGGFGGTLEFFPEEGKYHADGHRNCGVCLTPEETERAGGLCPVCGKKVTVGVWHRAAQLADRPEGFKPKDAAPFESLVPLPEVIAASTGFSAAGVKTAGRYEAMLRQLGPEFVILRQTPLEDIEQAAGPSVAEGIRRLRQGAVEVSPGYDGAYGKVSILSAADIDRLAGQTRLFADEPGKKAARPAQTLLPVKRAASMEAARLDTPSDGLNPEQRQAADARERTVAVIAGPGTGKTRTLVDRIARLTEEGTPPSHIAAVTFTNKAARQLRERLEKRLGKRTARAVTVGTFHALCLRLLEKWRGPVTLLDPAEALEIAAQVCRDTEVSARDLLDGVSRLKNGGESTLPPALIEAYAARLRELETLDFDDLLLETLAQLEGGRKPPAAFTHLLVDEFQDVNPIQFRLVLALNREGAGLFVIGDPDQAIYGFRGADSRCFEKLAAACPGLRVIRLTQNYRSTPEILRAALPVISARGEPRRLEAARPAGPKPGLLRAPEPFDEALYVVKAINAMVGGVDMLDAQTMHSRADKRKARCLSDIAVLYRTHRQAELLEYCLVKEGIPYTVAGREDYLSDGLVRRAAAFFRCLTQPADRVSRRVWLRGEGVEDVPEVPGWEGLAAALEGPHPDLAQRLRAFAPRVLEDKPLPLLRDWLAASGLEETEPLSRLCGAAGLAASMPDLLETLSLGREADVVRQGKTYTPDAVSLLTLHGSKGLEFPVVFLIGVQDGRIPLRRADTDREEERRRFYVGLTRAMDELILTGAGEPSAFLADIPPEALEEETARRRPVVKQLSLFD